MFYQKVEKTKKGNVFVIADIHACAKTFKHLVKKKLKLQKEDQLFLLGDYINRGPDNAGVFDFMLSLKEEKYQIYPLRGNHEQMLLDSHDNSKNNVISRYNNHKDLQDKKGVLKDKYKKLLINLPFYYEVGNFYLVHGGFNLNKDNFLKSYHDMIWVRGFKERADKNPEKLKGKRVVIGHTQYWLDDIKHAIKKKETVIPLDNGCYTGLNHNSSYPLGSLCALNLNTMELITQACLD